MVNHLFHVLKILTFTFLFFCLKSYSQDNIWQKINSSNKPTNINSEENASVYKLGSVSFQRELNKISEYSSSVLSFPVDNDNLKKFMVRETKVMHPDLAKKFPNIKSYKGVAIDGSKKTMQFTYSPEAGFFGVFQTTVYEKIEVKALGKSLHEFKTTSSQSNNNPFECQTEDLLQKRAKGFGVFNRDVDDGNLRRYRLALSVSGDYSQVFLDGTENSDTERKAKVLQGMVNSINRLNGIFERDFGITMQLIAETDLLIFLDPSTDPYSTSINLGNELSNTINSIITNDDYDVGHLFHAENNNKYGNAGCIACVCTDIEKGKAYSVHGNPDTDDMNLLAAHEFGHQFGAFHTQSSGNCRSGFNSEVEPGSGSTIMSYAGICPPNVQASSDDYFNYTSIRDVAIWTIDNANCAELIPTNNSAPIVAQGLDYVIPRSTPFMLEGSATDSDGNDVLTYCWEQNDPENPQSTNTPLPTNTLGPMFRSFPPSLSGKRYFPNLNDVLANNITPTWEVLPSVSRTLNFVMTVRDNGINGGQTVSDAVTINVSAGAGPFSVTSQVSNSEIWTVGNSVTVTWDVANTDLEPIRTSEVEIFLSTDGGLTFSTSLLVTENDGEETFSLPDVEATTSARLLIKAVDNVFFAVNQQSFTIEKSDFAILAESPSIDVCDSGNAVFNLEYKTFLDFDESVALTATSLPPGTSVLFTQDNFTEQSIEGTPFNVTLEGIDNLGVGNYSFNLEGISTNGIEKSIELDFSVYAANNVVPNLISPLNNSELQDIDVEFNWENDSNSVSYQIEIATDDVFTNIIEDSTTQSLFYIPSNLENNAEYYWRVRTLNPCGFSSFSDVFIFSTKCSTPTNIEILNVDFDSIEVTWEDTISTNSWTVEYGVSGFVLGSGTSVTITEKEFIAEGLESGTKYDFYINGNCSISGSSDMVGPILVTTSFNYCNGDHFYDSGGLNDSFKDNENITTQIYPDSDTDRIRARFDVFNLGNWNDILYVFDGESQNDTFIGGFRRSELQGQELVSTHESGALTFIFISDGFGNAPGWDATIVCEQKPNCATPINFQNTGLEGDEASFEWNAVGDDANWEIEYGEVGFVRGNGTIITTSVESVRIENLLPITSYDVYIKTICDLGGFSEVLGPFRFTTTELCASPFNVSFSNITNETAIATWENLNTGISNWQVEYGLNGFSLGSGTMQEVIEAQVLIEALNSNTDYQFYIRSNCEAEGDGFSNWVGPINFKTTPDYCGGDRFYDSGGESGNYSNRENITTVIYPKTLDERVRVIFDSFSVETCCDRLRIFDGPDTQSTLIGTYTTNPGNIVSTHESGALTFLFTSDSSATSSGWDAAIICEDRPNCEAPNNFQVSNIEARQVDFSWEQSDDEENWTIEYGIEGFVFGEGIEIAASTLNQTITSLTPDTPYDVYIRTNCEVGGFSDVLGPIKFRTDCGVLEAPYTESFVFQNTIPNCWSQSDNGNWNFNTFASWGAGNVQDRNPSNNSNYAWLDGDLSAFNGDYVLKSPWVDISALTNPAISFSVFSKNTIDDIYNTLNVSIYDSDGTLFTDIITVNSDTNIWKDFVIDLSDYAFTSTDIQIEFSVTLSQSGSARYNDILIDEVSFRELPSCTNPVNPLVNNITGRTAELSWVATDNEVNWEIQYGFSGFTTAEATTIFTEDNPYVLSDLVPERSYDVYIRAVCDIGDSSEFIGPIRFSTIELCPAPTSFRVVSTTKNTAELSWDDITDNATWEIEYAEGFFSPGAGTVETTSSNSITIENLVPDTLYYAYLRRDCGVDDGYSDNISIAFRTEVACTIPTGFMTESVTKNSVSLSWDDNIDVSEWEVEYNAGFFNPGNGIGSVQTSSTNSIDIENLLPDTLYYVYLRSNCGIDGYSNWTGYIGFVTPVSCSAPNNFVATNILPTEVEFSWDQNDSETNWTLEYGLQGFSLGSGNTVVSNTKTETISGLNPSTSYDVYIKTNCIDGGFSNVIGPLNFMTACDPDVDTSNLITNGGFECGSLSGWTLGGPNVFSGCRMNFNVLTNSQSVCTIVNNITRTEGFYAAFTSFDGDAGTTYSLQQTIEVPSDIITSTAAMLTFDFKVNYQLTFGNPTQNRVFTVRFTDLTGVELFNVEEIEFGLSPDTGGLDISFNEDILQNLSNYAGESIVINFEAFVPDTNTGPAKALIDNVSLIVEKVLSVENDETLSNYLMVYPVPNKGQFTVKSLLGRKIDIVEVFDVSGRLIQRDIMENPSEKFNVNMLNVDSGVYFVKVLTDGIKITKRIIIE